MVRSGNRVGVTVFQLRSLLSIIEHMIESSLNVHTHKQTNTKRQAKRKIVFTFTDVAISPATLYPFECVDVPVFSPLLSFGRACCIMTSWLTAVVYIQIHLSPPGSMLLLFRLRSLLFWRQIDDTTQTNAVWPVADCCCNRPARYCLSYRCYRLSYYHFVYFGSSVPM